MTELEKLFEQKYGVIRGAQSMLAKELKTSQGTIASWISGRNNPSPDLIKKMSKIFKKSEEELRQIFSVKDKNSNILPISVSYKVGYVPMLGEAFADRFKCIICEQEPELFLPVVKQGDKDFALKILGDCMVDPKDPVNSIYEGSYVIIRPGAKVAKGDVVLARRGDECTIKRFYFRNNEIHLVPDNPKYKKIVGTINEIEIMGKVIDIHRPIKKKKNPDYENEPDTLSFTPSEFDL